MTTTVIKPLTISENVIVRALLDNMVAIRDSIWKYWYNI